MRRLVQSRRVDTPEADPTATARCITADQHGNNTVTGCVENRPPGLTFSSLSVENDVFALLTGILDQDPSTDVRLLLRENHATEVRVREAQSHHGRTGRDFIRIAQLKREPNMRVRRQSHDR